MENILYDTLTLRSCHCDMFEAWRPSSILETMQETAGTHSAKLGLPWDVMTEMGLAWILSRVQVEMTRLPHVTETVHIETYPTLTRHLFYPRSHIFRDAQGQEIGRAESLWMVLDLNTRRVTRSAEVTAHLPENRDLQPALALPATVKPLEGPAQVHTMQPLFTDFDVNRHVNNTKYLDWCLNALGMEVMQERCVTSFCVNYDAEIRHGDQVRTELCLIDDHFSYCGFGESKRHFGVSGHLTGR